MNTVNRFVGLFTWVTILAVVVILSMWGYQAGLLHLYNPTPQEKFDAEEMQCAADTMLIDTKGEKSPRSNVVNERVIRTILNFAKVHKTNLCEIFRKQLTLIPIGGSRHIFDRWTIYVASEFGSTARTAALVLVQKVIDNPDPAWKATHYIRAPRGGTGGNQSDEEMGRIRESMTAIPKQKVKDPVSGKDVDDPNEGIIEFFEPKQ